jgi:hypothetical protein
MLFEQHHVGLAHRGQVVGDAAADDATTDDHDSGLGRHGLICHDFTLAFVGS